MDAGIQDIWRSQRLSFRSIREDDYEWWFTSFESDPVSLSLSAPVLLAPPTRTTPAEFLKMLADPKGSLLACVVCLRQPDAEETQPIQPPTDDGKKDTATIKPETRIGVVTLNYGGYGSASFHRAARFGIALAAPYQNKGYGTEATKWTLNWAFRYANLHSVNLGSVEYNKHAHKCYEKCGFTYTGRLRQCSWYDGKYWDFYHFDILIEEWREKNKTQ